LIKFYTCSKCKVEKEFKDFSKDSRKKSGIRGSCRACEKERMRLYDNSEAGKRRMRNGKWKQQGIDITHEVYTEMYSKQNGKCIICENEFKTLCVDHNHTTGKVRGLLCRQCNIGISALKENEQNFIKAIKYLKENDG
jgi:hypothetical protein